MLGTFFAAAARARSGGSGALPGPQRMASGDRRRRKNEAGAEKWKKFTVTMCERYRVMESRAL